MTQYRQVDLEQSLKNFSDKIVEKMKEEEQQRPERPVKAHPLKIYKVKVKRWFKKEQTQYRWQVKANNGEIVGASTESFVNRSDCEYNAKSTAKSILEHYGRL